MKGTLPSLRLVQEIFPNSTFLAWPSGAMSLTSVFTTPGASPFGFSLLPRPVFTQRVSFCPNYSSITSVYTLLCLTLALVLWSEFGVAVGREEGSSGTNERGGRGLWGWVGADRWYTSQNAGFWLHCWTVGSISLTQEVFLSLVLAFYFCSD